MDHYYYLGAFLPPLSFPSAPLESIASLRSVLEMNLSSKDQQRLQSFFLFVDILNLKPVFLEEGIDPRGNLGEKDLEESLLAQTFFPWYVFDFLEKNETLVDKLTRFSFLLTTFFHDQIAKQSGFLHRFFSFEREWRLISVAFRAKQMNKDVVKELQFDDPTDPFIAQILSQKDALTYSPPQEYEEMASLFTTQMDPWEQTKALAIFRFKKIEEMREGDLFTINGILAYLAQLMIIEYWNELDRGRGKIILDTFKTR